MYQLPSSPSTHHHTEELNNPYQWPDPHHPPLSYSYTIYTTLTLPATAAIFLINLTPHLHDTLFQQVISQPLHSQPWPPPPLYCCWTPRSWQEQLQWVLHKIWVLYKLEGNTVGTKKTSTKRQICIYKMASLQIQTNDTVPITGDSKVKVRYSPFATGDSLLCSGTC